MIRIASAGFLHESNTFSAIPASLDLWQRSGILEGDAIRREYAQSQSTLAGFLALEQEDPQVQVVPLVFSRLTPMGAITPDAIEHLFQRIVDAIRDNGPWDGVLLPQHGAAVSEPNLAELLDLVALGTIADVVPLDHANRILVANGLGRIRAGRARPGLAALLKQGGRSHVRARTSDLAFAAAPRLNAAGRLDDMTLGVECLLAGDAGRAQEFALRLEQLNLERRAVEAQMAEQAAGDLEALVAERQGALPAAVCLTGTDWHAGVVGIVAGRIKDRVHRPVVAFAPDGTDALKGSARSVAGVHVREVLAAVDAAHPGLIERFGGHAAAAGLTIAADRYAEFRDAFVGAVERLGEDALSGGELASDGPLAAGEIGHALARALADGGPWGPGFEEPVFDNRFEVLGARVVGDAHLKLDLRHPDGGGRIDAIAFNQAQLADGSRQVHLAYRLDLNTFRGVTAPQLVVEALDPVA